MKARSPKVTIIKGHDNQRSHLSNMTHVFWAILAVEVDGGILSIS